MTDPTHMLMTAARQEIDALMTLTEARRSHRFAVAQYGAMRAIAERELAGGDALRQQEVLEAIADVDEALARLMRVTVPDDIEPGR